MFVGADDCGAGDCPTRANEASISSWVRFLDRRKEIFCSIGAEETEGSWRTVAGVRCLAESPVSFASLTCDRTLNEVLADHLRGGASVLSRCHM